MPESVLIRYDNAILRLNCPHFFESSTTGNIKKAFRLIRDRPRQNEIALETLDRFFLAWEQNLKQQLECKTQKRKDADQAKMAAESKVACFGTMATKEMKAELQEAQSTLKKAALAVKRTKSALERCDKIKNAYNEILR